MREVIQALKVWDTTVRRQVLLPPGTILRECQIRKQVNGVDGVEVYAVEFESEGRRLACPLFRFQPRTKALDEAIKQLSAIS